VYNCLVDEVRDEGCTRLTNDLYMISTCLDPILTNKYLVITLECSPELTNEPVQ
jgi:hypothetical protein